MKSVERYVAFRVDCSPVIGTGHLSRCLTLAEELKRRGVEITFVCRHLPGSAADALVGRGFILKMLNDWGGLSVKELRDYGASQKVVNGPAHSGWLGVSQEEDAGATVIALAGKKYDWLVVDHYALDAEWESELGRYVERILVIDDLADRAHACDVILDQNLGREAADYDELVPDHCERLVGPQYALLRPDFAALRPYSLQRRQSGQLKHVLISMGGVDLPNASAMALSALRECLLPDDTRITVVMGSLAPWLVQVRALAAAMPWPTEVRVEISDMGQVMADSDLAIGAAGSTSWERCCLGLPALLLILAENQRFIAQSLDERGAVISLGGVTPDCPLKLTNAVDRLIRKPNALNAMSGAASALTDGMGTHRVVGYILDK